MMHSRSRLVVTSLVVLLLWIARVSIASSDPLPLQLTVLLAVDAVNCLMSLRLVSLFEASRGTPIFENQPASFLYVLPIVAGFYATLDLVALAGAQ